MSSSDAAAKRAVETQAISGFSVCGLSIVTANDQDQAAADINDLWQRFIKDDWLHQIENRADNVIYVVYSDYEGDHTKPFRVTLGCKVSGENSLSPDLHTVHAPASDYVIFAARGEQPQALLTVWENIWKSDLPRRFETDLEIYGPRFFEPGLHEVLVCVGVKT